MYLNLILSTATLFFASLNLYLILRMRSLTREQWRLQCIINDILIKAAMDEPYEQFIARHTTKDLNLTHIKKEFPQ